MSAAPRAARKRAIDPWLDKAVAAATWSLVPLFAGLYGDDLLAFGTRQLQGRGIPAELLPLAIAFAAWAAALRSARPFALRLLAPSLVLTGLLGVLSFALALRLQPDQAWMEGIAGAATLLLAGRGLMCLRRVAPAGPAAPGPRRPGDTR